MTKFNVGDWVYASDWCYGYITKIEDGFAVVEYDTGSGEGSCSFMFEDMVKAWPPKKNVKKITIDVDKSIKELESFKYHINNTEYAKGANAVLNYCIEKLKNMPESKGE